MKIRTLLLGSIAAAGLAAAGMAVTTMAPVSQEVRINAPSQPAPARALPQTSAREEGERVRDLSAVPVRSFRRYWDGKNRTAGDRAHKRMKHRRASGRR